jgi:TolB-like protein
MRHTRLTLALAAAAAIAVGAMVPSAAVAASVEPAAPPAVAQPAATPMRVLVLPFAPVANEQRDAWIGRAISEALTADLSIDRALSVSTEKTNAVDDLAGAIEAGKKAGVQRVIFGTFQSVGENVRVTGQIADVESGKATGGIKATGPLQELFSLQDSLVHQIELRLGRPGLPAPPPQPAHTDSPLPLKDPADDGVFGVPLPPRHRPISWLDDDASRSDDFARDMRTAHDDYVYNAPGPVYYNAYYAPAGLGRRLPARMGWRVSNRVGRRMGTANHPLHARIPALFPDGDHQRLVHRRRRLERPVADQGIWDGRRRDARDSQVPAVSAQLRAAALRTVDRQPRSAAAAEHAGASNDAPSRESRDADELVAGCAGCHRSPERRGRRNHPRQRRLTRRGSGAAAREPQSGRGCGSGQPEPSRRSAEPPAARERPTVTRAAMRTLKLKE